MKTLLNCVGLDYHEDTIRGVLRDERASAAPANPWTKKWLSWVREGAAVGEELRWVLDKQLH